jgi:plastocyanin domain-containing protein
MNVKPLTLTGLVLTLALTLAMGVPAQEDHGTMDHPPEATGQFQRIEQPLWSKVAVASAGLGLIGLELWWFVFSKPKPPKAAVTGE